MSSQISTANKRRSWNPTLFQSHRSEILSFTSVTSPTSSNSSTSPYSMSPPGSRPISLIESAFSEDHPKNTVLQDSTQQTNNIMPMPIDSGSYKSPILGSLSRSQSLNTRRGTSPSNAHYMSGKSHRRNNSLFSVVSVSPSSSISRSRTPDPFLPSSHPHRMSGSDFYDYVASSTKQQQPATRLSRHNSLQHSSPSLSSKRWSNSSSTMVESNRKSLMTEQERLLQEKLQQLARSENDRLNQQQQQQQHQVSSKSNSSSSITSPSSETHFLHYSSQLSSSGSDFSPAHQRHLSLQPYYNSNNRAPDMGSRPMSPVSHKFNNHTSILSPRAIARAEALAALNSGAHNDNALDSVLLSQSPEKENDREFADKEANRSFTFSYHLNGTNTPQYAFANNYNNEDHGNNNNNNNVQIPPMAQVASLKKRRRNMGGSPSNSVRNSMSDTLRDQVSQGYYIISASDLERLAQMELDHRNETLNGIKKPNNIEGEFLSWKMTGNIMKTWMTAYKSPGAVVESMQYLWSVLTNGEAVRQEVSKTFIHKEEEDEEDYKQQHQQQNHQGTAELVLPAKHVKDWVLPPKEVVVSLKDTMVRSIAQASWYNLIDFLKLLRRVAVGSFCASFAFTVIFIQVSLLSVMVIAYLLGDILVTPTKYVYQKVIVAEKNRHKKSKSTNNNNIKQEEVEKNQEKKNELVDESTNVTTATDNNKPTKDDNTTNNNNKANKRGSSLVQKEIKKLEESLSKSSTTTTNNNNNKRPPPTSPILDNNNNNDHSLKTQTKRNSANLTDASVLAANAMRARKAALKNAKRKSKQFFF